ncbi:MAG: S26 family signal peptidase [Streptosporangiaceae bacterium]
MLAVALAAVGSAGLLGLTVGFLRWRYSVVTVTGPSMEPELHDGDRLLVRRCGLGALRRDQLVIFSEPGVPGSGRPIWRTRADRWSWVIKRVAAVPGDRVPDCVRAAAGRAQVVPAGAVVVLGTGPGSRDSRQWGFVTSRHVFGVGVRSVRPRPDR